MRNYLSSAVCAAAALATMNAQPLPPPNQTPIPRLQENQQKRIARGTETAKLTANDATHMEHHQAAIRRQANRDRAAHGGRLTAGERAQINHEMDRTSVRIHRDKHPNLPI
jgi:hypothetical protein